MESRFRLFPDVASSIAGRVDALYFFLVAVTFFFTTLIAVLILFFAVRYRRSANVDRRPPREFLALEVGWSLVPLGLTMIMFTWGAWLFVEQQKAPAGADEIQVIGRQWMWKLQHANGRREIDELHLPVGRPVKLTMISEDVIHSFYLPDFRVKQDVLPGRYTTMWFTPTQVGEFHLFCAEYCGTSHAKMRGRVVVLEPGDFARWLAGGGVGLSPAASGRQLFEQFRCPTCHQATTAGRGPPLERLFGRDVRLADGRTVRADETYLRESILDPQAKVVAGFQPLMPTFQGQIGEEGLLAIVAYLKSLGDPPPAGGEQRSESAPPGSPPSEPQRASQRETQREPQREPQRESPPSRPSQEPER